jgi:predicted transcriptional regulator
MTYSTVPLTAGALDQRVADLMHEHPVTIPASMPLAAAARQMARRRVHAILVRDEVGGPLGWVTARGLLHNVPRDWAGAAAGDAISEALVTIRDTASAREALEAFAASGASHLLVVGDPGGVVRGVVAESDMLWVLAPDGPSAPATT